MTYDVMASNANKIREWLESGQGVAVWENLAFDSSGFGHNIFTPGTAEKLHWAHRLVEITHDSTKFRIFSRIDVLKMYSDTISGCRAAYRWLETYEGTASAPNGRDAPLGHFEIRYTVERVTFTSDETVPYLNPANGSRPLRLLAFTGIVQWEHLTPAPAKESN